jgi:outer membrane protein assembly factor BamD
MKKGLFLFLIPVVLFSSCSQYGKVLKSPDRSLRFNKALEYYRKMDYIRAQQLLESLLPFYRGQDSSEIVYYYYANCFYGLKDYQTASYHFQSFTENFFNSKHQMECAYKAVYCRVMAGNPSYLDQSDTRRTMDDIQAFINQYPNSRYVDTCNILMDDLRAKMQQKAYDNAFLYYKIGDYKSAAVSLRNVLRDYPELENKEYVEYLIVRSSYLYASNSVETRKEERLLQALEEVSEYRQDNPRDAPNWDEVKKLEERINRDLETLRRLKNLNN